MDKQKELEQEIARLEKEVQYWHEKCQSYEQTIVKLCETIIEKGHFSAKNMPPP